MAYFMRVITIILCLVLSGCKWFSGMNRTFSSMTNMVIPEGTPLFQKGFRDGCGNAFYARGNGFYRARYSYRFDGNLAGNTEYRFGISRGYGYCFAYIVAGVFGGPQASSDKFLFPHGYDDTYNSGDIGGAWSGFFSGGDQWKSGVISADSNTIDGVFNVYQNGISGGSAFDTGGGGVIWGGNSRGQFFGQ